jgi:hypothetical protein
MRRIEGRREVFKPAHMRVHGVVDYDEDASYDDVVATIGRWAGYMLAQVEKDFAERNVVR